MNNAVGKILLVGVLGALMSCTANVSQPDVRKIVPEFEALETRLLAAQAVEFDFHIIAEGAIGVDLKGSFRLKRGENIRVSGAGEFAGEPAALLLSSSGGELELRSGEMQRNIPIPLETEKALLLGMTRMGLLHNLAQLMSANPPDHAEGGVEEWVILRTMKEKMQVHSFELFVGGQPAGTASLEVDTTGVPIVRMQTVKFPGGEMRVVEKYFDFKIFD